MNSTNNTAAKIAANVAADTCDTCDLCGAAEVVDVVVNTQHGDVFVCANCLDTRVCPECGEIVDAEDLEVVEIDGYEETRCVDCIEGLEFAAEVRATERSLMGRL